MARAMGRDPAWQRIDPGYGDIIAAARAPRPMVQAKLAIGAPEDAAEIEADRVADALLHDGDGADARVPEAVVQRQADDAAAPHVPDLDARVGALRGGGKPLSPSTRAFVEPRLGADLGDVRVHTGGAAGELAHDLRARAFTSGHDIAFAAGKYEPDTPSGMHLLAHELTHVVQQGHGGPAVVHRQPAPGDPPKRAPGLPARLPIPPSIDVTWGGEPFVVEIVLLQSRENGNDNDLVFRVRYAGKNEIDGGPSRGFVELRVADIKSLDDARLIQNDDPQAMRIDIDLRPEFAGALTATLTDEIYPLRGPRPGRRHSLTALAEGHGGASASVTLYDRKGEATRPLPPLPRPEAVPPGQASAEPASQVGNIWSDDVYLGGFHDKFRLTVQPESATTALFGMTAMQGVRIYGGGGAILTSTRPFAPAIVHAGGDTIALALHGGKAADLSITDSIAVPAANQIISGDARRDRDHHVKIHGADLGSDLTFEFMVRGGWNMGRDVRGTDVDVRATANAMSVTHIPPQLEGGIDEEARRYENAIFEKRNEAFRFKAISAPVFESYAVLYVALSELKRQVAAGKVDGAQQGIAASYAVKLTVAVNNETNPWPTFAAREGAALSAAIIGAQWAKVWKLWRDVLDKLDAYIEKRVKAVMGKNSAEAIHVLAGARHRADELRDKKGLVRLAALYFPDAQYRSQTDTPQAIPLSIHYFREDGKWKLKDFTDPEKDPVKHEVPDKGTAEPPVELFTQLDHLSEYPKGIIRWQIPGGSSGAFATTDKQTTGEKVRAWLGRIALAAGMIGLALTGVGAVADVALLSTAGTVFFAVSAAAGVAAATADMVVKARQGTLTGLDVVVDVAQIAASLAALGTLPRGYFVGQLARGAVITGRAAKLAELASTVYIPLRAVNLGADVATVIAVTAQTLEDLEKIKKLPVDQQLDAWLVTVAQLIVTAGMSVVSIKGARAEILEGTPMIRLRIDEHGIPIAELQAAAVRPRAGGTRGSYAEWKAGEDRPTYVMKKDKSECSPGNLADRVRQGFVTSSRTQRPLAHGATLDLAPAPAAAAGGAKAPQTAYVLVIPATGTAGEIRIPVTIESTNALPKSVHGAETGPASMTVRSYTDAKGTAQYEATIQVHRDLAGTDVRHAVGHELDELALIARRGLRGDAITAQKRVGLMQSARAPAPGTAAPATTMHDTATAMEFAHAMPTPGARTADYELPAELRSRALDMGFDNTTFLEEKLALLRNVGVDEDMLARLRVMATRTEQVLPRLPAGSGLGSERIVGHLIYPSKGTVQSPVGGAHLDSTLTGLQTQLVTRNDPIHLVPTADSPRVVGGVTYKAYEQWRWKGNGPPGPRPARPGGAAAVTLPTPKPTSGGFWELMSEPKTTFDRLGDFVAEADGAFANYRKLHGVAPNQSNVRWSAASPSGQQIGGYMQTDAAGRVTHISVFPDRIGGVASW